MTARLERLTGFALTTASPERLAAFYVDALGFTAAPDLPIPAREVALLGVGGGMRRALAYAGQTVFLDRFDAPGRPYPADADAADLLFQHFALVVADIDQAWQRLGAHGAMPISTEGPVTLPPEAGSVRAVKFRDPEGHPLELLQFPAASAARIDHSAVSVADADASAAFYASLGLRASGRTLNQGAAQAKLDGLARPLVDVVPMLPAVSTPHLELLGYRTPRGRPMPPTRPNDVWATRLLWQADRDALLADPDGHLHVLLA